MREYSEPLIIGECGDIPHDELWKFSDPSRNELTATILFDIMNIDFDFTKYGKFSPREFTIPEIGKII